MDYSSCMTLSLFMLFIGIGSIIAGMVMLSLVSPARNKSSETGGVSLSERVSHDKPIIVAYISACIVGLAFICASLFGMDVREIAVNEREVISSHKITAFEPETSQGDVYSGDFVIHSTEVSVFGNGDDVYVVMVDQDDTGSYTKEEYPVDDTRIAFDASTDTARVETVRTTTMIYEGTFLGFDVDGEEYHDDTVIHVPEETMETPSTNTTDYSTDGN